MTQATNDTMNPERELAGNLGLEPTKGKAGKTRWRWVVLVLVILAAGFFLWSRTSTGAAPTRYKTQETKKGTISVVVTATGTLNPTNEVEVSSELSGIIKSVHVDYNDRLTTGQMLAVLDSSKLNAQVAQSKAALEAAQAKVNQVRATLKETRRELGRLQNLYVSSNHQTPSRSDLEAAQAAYERAKADEASALAEVAQAQAALEAYETDLGKTTLRSPIDGVVIDRAVEPGQTVASSLQAPVLFTLAEDLTQMELSVNVDEADVGKVRAGQKATFVVSAYPNRTYEASITQVRYGSTTVSGVVTYETVLKVDNADLSLRPGMTATADIQVQTVENALLLPNAALRFTPPVEEAKTSGSLLGSLLPRPPGSPDKKVEENGAGQKSKKVWQLKDGQLTPISVLTGVTDGTYTEIVEGGLVPGDAMVVDVALGSK